MMVENRTWGGGGDPPPQARSEDFKRGGGEISNVVFKKILKN